MHVDEDILREIVRVWHAATNEITVDRAAQLREQLAKRMNVAPLVALEKRDVVGERHVSMNVAEKGEVSRTTTITRRAFSASAPVKYTLPGP